MRKVLQRLWMKHCPCQQQVRYSSGSIIAQQQPLAQALLQQVNQQQVNNNSNNNNQQVILQQMIRYTSNQYYTEAEQLLKQLGPTIAQDISPALHLLESLGQQFASNSSNNENNTMLQHGMHDHLIQQAQSILHLLRTNIVHKSLQPQLYRAYMALIHMHSKTETDAVQFLDKAEQVLLQMQSDQITCAQPLFDREMNAILDQVCSKMNNKDDQERVFARLEQLQNSGYLHKRGDRHASTLFLLGALCRSANMPLVQHYQDKYLKRMKEQHYMLLLQGYITAANKDKGYDEQVNKLLHRMRDKRYTTSMIAHIALVYVQTGQLQRAVDWLQHASTKHNLRK